MTTAYVCFSYIRRPYGLSSSFSSRALTVSFIPHCASYLLPSLDLTLLSASVTTFDSPFVPTLPDLFDVACRVGSLSIIIVRARVQQKQQVVFGSERFAKFVLNFCHLSLHPLQTQRTASCEPYPLSSRLDTYLDPSAPRRILLGS